MEREYRQGSVAPPGHESASGSPAPGGSTDGAAGLFRRFRRSLQQAEAPPAAAPTPPAPTRAFSHGAYVPLRPLEDVISEPRAVAPEHFTREQSATPDAERKLDPSTPLYGEMPLSRFPDQH